MSHTTRHARESSRGELNKKEAPSEPHNWRPPTERAVFQLPRHRDGFDDYEEPASIYVYPPGGLNSPTLSLSTAHPLSGHLSRSPADRGYVADREKCQDGRQTWI